MSRVKIIGFFLVFCFYASTSFALVISEIEFDPAGSDTDREWVEIFNETNNSIKFDDYKFFEESVNHGITSLVGDGNINSGEYVLLFLYQLFSFHIRQIASRGKLFCYPVNLPAPACRLHRLYFSNRFQIDSPRLLHRCYFLFLKIQTKRRYPVFHHKHYKVSHRQLLRHKTGRPPAY